MFTKVYLNVKIKIELFGKTELVRNPNKLKPYRGYYRNGYSLVMTLMSFAEVTSVGLALESLGVSIYYRDQPRNEPGEIKTAKSDRIKRGVNTRFTTD